MPDSRAIVALNAAARIRSPAEVYLNAVASTSVVTSTAATTKMSKRDTPSGVPPILSPVTENAVGNDRNWPPKKMPASPSRRTSSPMVTITALSGGLFMVGRMMVTWQSAPRTTPDASATANPAQ